MWQRRPRRGAEHPSAAPQRHHRVGPQLMGQKLQHPGRVLAAADVHLPHTLFRKSDQLAGAIPGVRSGRRARPESEEWLSLDGK